MCSLTWREPIKITKKQKKKLAKILDELHPMEFKIYHAYQHLNNEKQNEMKDLTKILRDGDEVYSIIHGEMVKISKNSVSIHFPFVIKNGDYASVELSKYGGYYGKGDGECLIFPSKEERNWDNFKRKEASIEHCIVIQGSIGGYQVWIDGDKSTVTKGVTIEDLLSIINKK